MAGNQVRHLLLVIHINATVYADYISIPESANSSVVTRANVVYQFIFAAWILYLPRRRAKKKKKEN